jgi:hypothetical protein
MTAKLVSIFGLSLVTVAIATSIVQGVSQLTMNGQVVSSKVKLVDGQLMVPVRDIATFFGYDVRISGSTAQLSRNAPYDQGTSGLPQPLVSPTTAGTPQAPLPAPVPSTDTIAPAMPNLAQPMQGTTSAFQPANQGLFPNTPVASPTALTGTVGAPTGFGDFAYSVEKITDVGGKYRTVYDQRGETFSPFWKDDKLVAVTLLVTNTGKQAESPLLPGAFSVTVFDSQKVGYPANYFDVRQTSPMEDTNYGSPQWDIAPIQSDQGLLLAPGGSIRYAVVASVPKDMQVSQVLISLPAGSDSTKAGGALLTVSK